MATVSRRSFFQGATLAASAVRVMGANDRLGIAIVGLGGRGTAHVEFFSEFPECRIVALCDVNQAARERAQARLKALSPGAAAAEYNDMRDVFAKSEVDGVTLPLPNHWHALATVWACQAGKDVYVEKPACYNIYESRRMVEAARQYKRVVQVGLQSRSTAHKIHGMQMIREGALGKVYMAKGLCFKRRPSIGRTPAEATPPGVDWEKFLGPAPLRPFQKNRFTYNWHWFWDTGAGDITNQGAHEMDMVCWGMGDPGMPREAVSTGGKYVYDDDKETPNTQLSVFSYGDREIVFDVRGLMTGPEAGQPVRTGVEVMFGEKLAYRTVGAIFLGENGWMWMDNDSLVVYKGESNEKAHEEKSSQRAGHVGQMRNWLEVCRSRKIEDLHCEIAVGAKSAAVSHLAGISYRLGHKVRWDDAKGKFVDDPEADRLITREYRKPYVL